VVLTSLDEEAFGRVAFTLVCRGAVLLHNRCRHQRHHFTQVRLENRRPHHLVIIGARTVAMDLVQARGTVPRFGGNIPRAVQRHSRGVLQKGHRFPRLPALELPKNTLEQRAEQSRRDRIAYLPHPRIARNACDAVDCLQLPLSTLLIKGEEGRGLQRKPSERGHQSIG
jgi:hypothetical protein